MTIQRATSVLVPSAMNENGVGETSSDLQGALYSLFAAARDEVFEDGIENALSTGLMSLVHTGGNSAVSALVGIVQNPQVNPDVIAEALRWLGRMTDTATHMSRLRLLEQALSHSSGRVRDGAVIGLAYLDDRRAIPTLRNAIRREKIAELRDDMAQVLSQLENTEPWPIS